MWASIIHGALGIVYFPEFAYCGSGGALLQCRAGDGMHQVITSVNSQIQALAPVIDSPSHNTGSTASTRCSNSSYYVFSMVSRGSTPGQAYTFSLPAGFGASTATVLNENRSPSVTGGTFTNTFAQEYSYHIYKITPGA